jgi:hypothetical protein
VINNFKNLGVNFLTVSHFLLWNVKSSVINDGCFFIIVWFFFFFVGRFVWSWEFGEGDKASGCGDLCGWSLSIR